MSRFSSTSSNLDTTSAMPPGPTELPRERPVQKQRIRQAPLIQQSLHLWRGKVFVLARTSYPSPHGVTHRQVGTSQEERRSRSLKHQATQSDAFDARWCLAMEARRLAAR